jgi:hypothetical protein
MHIDSRIIENERYGMEVVEVIGLLRMPQLPKIGFRFHVYTTRDSLGGISKKNLTLVEYARVALVALSLKHKGTEIAHDVVEKLLVKRIRGYLAESQTRLAITSLFEDGYKGFQLLPYSPVDDQAGLDIIIEYFRPNVGAGRIFLQIKAIKGPGPVVITLDPNPNEVTYRVQFDPQTIGMFRLKKAMKKFILEFFKIKEIEESNSNNRTHTTN